MGKQTVSAESGRSDADNEDADIEISEASEEEEPSEEEPSEEEPSEEEPIEEEPIEEDLDADEPQKVESCEEPDEDSTGPNEGSICKQEPDGVASCEVDPNEEASSGEEPNENISWEEEHNEVDSCASTKEEACTGEQNEESSEEEPYEEDKKCGEEKIQKGEESVEEETVEESEEEELSEDPEEESSAGSPLNQSYNRNSENSAQFHSGKMTLLSDIPSGTKKNSEQAGTQNSSNNVIVPEKPNTRSTGKRRHSRWDVKDEDNELAEDDGNMATKERKTQQSRHSKKGNTLRSRWSNDDSQSSMTSSLKNPDVKIDLEILKLHAELLQITKKLQSGVIDDRPESERSPSPPPIYNNLGIRINTREIRLRSKLMTQRQTIISELIQKSPNFKPPPDYKTSKFQKRLYIPSKEYPGYNFIGLILGPRGNTQKRMEEETGARIRLRGKGSKHCLKMMEKSEPSDNDELHVLIEAENMYALDAAVAMVEKLLIPVQEGINAHKLSQLRELAKLKGTLRVTNTGNSRKPDPCNVCGNTSHPTCACPLTAPASGANSNGHQVNFFAEMGGGLSPFSNPPLHVSTTPPMANSAAHVSESKREIDDAKLSKLFIGFLPQSVDNKKLRELFSPFGPLYGVRVIRDRSTGLSKGYGFIKCTNNINAANAVAKMNGYKIDGKMLAVRIAGILPSPGHTSTGSSGDLSVNQFPSYPGSAVIAQNNPDPMHRAGPPVSRLPETVASFSSISTSLQIRNSPLSGQYSTSTTPPMANSAAHVSESKREIDDANLFIGFLPQSVDSNKLWELFSPFGPLCDVQVIRDKSTGLSKGYGFIKYTNNIDAAKAVAKMNGYKIDGKMLAVRIAGILPSPGHANTASCGHTNTASSGALSVNQLPNYPGPAVIAQNNPDPHWAGPPVARLPETVASSSNISSSLQIHNSPFSGQYYTSLGLCPTPISMPFSRDLATFNELTHFPGYVKSLDFPSQLYHQSTPSSSLASSQVHFTQNFGSYQMPPT